MPTRKRSNTGSTVGAIGATVVAMAPTIAPGPSANLLRRLADYAIDGVGPLPGARIAAGHALEHKTGDVEAALDSLVRNHVAMAGAQGFVSNLGGVVTAIAAIPANLAAVAVVQTRMVATIAHLRGYDLSDLRVREAIWMTLLGRHDVDDLVAAGKLPSTPLGVATAPVLDSALEQRIAEQVLATLVGRSGGKQTLAMMSKRIPLVGGGVGMATDGWFTWTVASYARDVFAPRRLPELPSPEQVVDEEQPAPQPEPDVRDAEWSEEDD
ncbi:EcsC family protein [Propionibacterium freudenreichii]|uniref:EcsC family protein n=1 Tax=Propionibacterium freudenreichii TaxID=1744 RepID=A0A2C7AMV5_9ACTN|nr:EcsC family protein [Propionibacterium freudenreichii]MDN5984712.1 EcsC family protein [Propionibacterium sp.]MCT2973734.1 hypothetical protein [Propionibacterium freudenreichii]MCT2976729.1 hypothetical protein [Propionibacterium freudenreichii]MCT2998579.1 hypothetical protein [Propionibacterium freudenreichii]MCT3002267.1 hypothetical protein [Propionibacterium freudenreichii]